MVNQLKKLISEIKTKGKIKNKKQEQQMWIDFAKSKDKEMIVLCVLPKLPQRDGFDYIKKDDKIKNQIKVTEYFFDNREKTKSRPEYEDAGHHYTISCKEEKEKTSWEFYILNKKEIAKAKKWIILKSL